MPGPQELFVIAVVALLVFGPDRLPELARTAARALAKVRNEAARNVQDFRRSAEIAELERDLKQMRSEFRDTSDEFKRSSRELLDGGPQPSPRVRADDAPPPTDPEAT